MDALDAVAIAAAGAGAGMINAVVGSGTLITFPTLLALGFAPVTANVSNNVGLLGGGLSGAWGYRRELRHDGATLRRLAPASMLGAGLGSWLLLTLPSTVFEGVVVVLIAVAVVLVLAQPRLVAVMRARRAEDTTSDGAPARLRVGLLLLLGVAAAGVYGGYFGAAQGVLLIGMLGLALPGDLQRVNGMKNVLSFAVNLVAAVVFVTVRPSAISWSVVGLIAVGSWIGGALGARWGRRLSPTMLRSIVVLVGLIAIVRLVGRG